MRCRSHHSSKSSDNSRSAEMWGMPTVRRPIVTLLTESTRVKIVITIIERPLCNTSEWASTAPGGLMVALT